MYARQQYEPALLPVCGYLRRSTDRQEQSLDDQRDAIETYATEHGMDIIQFYVDDAITGTSVKGRDDFQKIIHDAQQPRCPFRKVLVYDVKRFGRTDTDEAGHYRHILKKCGVEVIYTHEGFTGDDSDDLVRGVKQYQARQESKDLSLVTIRGLLSRTHKGRWNGGTPPYGFDLAYYSGNGEFLMIVRFQPDGSKHELDAQGQLKRVLPKGEKINFSTSDYCTLIPSAPERVDVIRLIFKLYAKEGLGFNGVADRLNSLLIPAPRGGKRHSPGGTHQWGGTTIREILFNPAFVGDLAWNRTTSGKFHRIASGKAAIRQNLLGRGPEKNAQQDWELMPNAHTALVTRELFDKAQALRTERRQGLNIENYRSGQGARSPYLISGVLECLHCGHRWQGHAVNKGKPRKDGTKVRTLYYACNGYINKGKNCCTNKKLEKEKIEDWALNQIGGIVTRYLATGGEEALRELIHAELAAEKQDGVPSLTDLQAKRTTLDTEMTKAVQKLLNCTSSSIEAVLTEHIEKLREELSQIGMEEERLRTRQHEAVQIDELVETVLQMVTQVPRIAQTGSIDEQRRLIRAFTEKIEFDPITGSGIAHFWALPQTLMPDSGKPRGKRKRSDCSEEKMGNTTAGSNAAGADEDSSYPIRAGETRSDQKRRPPEIGGSSLMMVAGAGFEPATFGL